MPREKLHELPAGASTRRHSNDDGVAPGTAGGWQPGPDQRQWFEPSGLGKLTGGLYRDVKQLNITLLPAAVLALTAAESRQLTGRQLDAIYKAKLGTQLGTKWLMTKQECWYRPPRPPYAGGSGSDERSPASDTAQHDIAVLMVDSRKPMPYYVPGTDLRSPDGWGLPRTKLHAGWTPSSGMVGRQVEYGLDTSAGTFQMALAVNHIYTQLHGYKFYLENPCPTTVIGVDEEMWRRSLDEGSRRRERFRPSLKTYMNREHVCRGLPASHRLGPFPPRSPPWLKLAALRYVLRRHSFVAYMDSDCYVTEVWQPLWPLLKATGLDDGRWIAAAEEYPPQKLRSDKRAGLANSGIMLLAGVPRYGAPILQMLEEWIWPFGERCNKDNPDIPAEQRFGCNPTWAFMWPYEQNALTNSIFARYPERYTLLRPGCPLNSPFGAFVRHLVGGTPAEAVYSDELRETWMMLALQCTLGIVLGAVHTPDGGSEGGALQVSSCTPNEPKLILDAAGCDETRLLRHSKPLHADVFARVRASHWVTCCALCHETAECQAWSHDQDRPAGVINCWLMRGFGSTRHSQNQVIGRRRQPRPARERYQRWETFDVPARASVPGE